VYPISGRQVRNRCANGDDCGFCHHPDHPRTRGRRRKKESAAEKDPQQTEKSTAWQEEDMLAEKNGSETSTRDSWSDRDEKAKPAALETPGGD
jgi:hypothetical protein